jgi:hypothetical protein
MAIHLRAIDAVDVHSIKINRLEGFEMDISHSTNGLKGTQVARTLANVARYVKPIGLAARCCFTRIGVAATIAAPPPDSLWPRRPAQRA